MDPKDLTIGVLSTTAVILIVGIVIIHSRPEPAMASGMTASTGDYVATVGTVSTDDEELLFVIDATQQKLNVYRFDIMRSRFEVTQQINLEELREAAGAQSGKSTKQGPKRRSGRRGRP
ncbi:MAG: hypothetical protein ACE5HE_06590 [Phycisphaerae bacterium]